MTAAQITSELRGNSVEDVEEADPVEARKAAAFKMFDGIAKRLDMTGVKLSVQPMADVMQWVREANNDKPIDQSILVDLLQEYGIQAK